MKFVQSKTWKDVLTRLSNLLTFQRHALGKFMCTKGTGDDLLRSQAMSAQGMPQFHEECKFAIFTGP